MDALSTANESPIIDGYSFRILAAESDQVKGVKHYIVDGKMTGGFAVIASPVKCGDSGIMTSIVNRDGVVYQRDLDPTRRRLRPGSPSTTRRTTGFPRNSSSQGVSSAA